MNLVQAKPVLITEKQKKYIIELSAETGISLKSLNIDDIDALGIGQGTVVIDYLLTRRAAGDDTRSYTYRLYLNGASIDEICKMRSMKGGTVCVHLIDKALKGWPLRWREILSEEDEMLIVKIANTIGTLKLRTIKDQLPDRITYFQIKAAIVKNDMPLYDNS